MTKNPSTPCVNIQKPEPSFKVNPTNPLKEIHSIDKSKYPTVELLWDVTRARLERLFGNRYMSRTLPTLVRMSAPIITLDSRERFEVIFRKYSQHLVWLHDGNIREEMGAIEKTLITADDVPRYDHHIIPRSRWWVDGNGNYLGLDKGDHTVFHEVFSNLTPIEQITHIILLFRGQYDPWMIQVLCSHILQPNQTQNIHYRTHLLRHEKVEYPKGVWSFMRNLSQD